MGFGISYQKVGINRCGKFVEPCRTKGPRQEREGHGDRSVPATSIVNEPWRRISDLVGPNAETTDPKVRKRCARKLVSWIQRKWEAEYSKERGEARKIRLTEGWDWDVGDWRVVDRGGVSLEGICFRLGMRQRKLDSLLRETLKISGQELLDGFCVRGLRGCLIAQLRLAAQKLWDSPGEFAKRRCMKPHPPAPSPFHGEGENDPPLSPLMKGGKTAGAALRAPGRRDAGATAGRMPALQKRSRYFRTQPWEFFGMQHGDEEFIRVRELLGKLDEVRVENDFSLEAFAASLGFGSVQNFKRACLNVMGRTLEQLERILAKEVVDYYLAAEDRVLRESCFREDEFGMRAREIYCGDAEKVPAEPFCDRWSTWEQLKPEWIAGMREQFG